MPEQAERSRRRIQCIGRVVEAKDVVVLVEGRTVADFNVVVDGLGTAGDLAEILPVLGRERLERPEARRLSLVVAELVASAWPCCSASRASGVGRSCSA